MKVISDVYHRFMDERDQRELAEVSASLEMMHRLRARLRQRLSRSKKKG